MNTKRYLLIALLFGLITLWADDLPPTITHLPLMETPMYESPQYVEAIITDDTTYNSPITEVRLHYSTDGTVFYYLNMTPGPNNKYYGSIPAYPTDTRVMYYITAKDSSNNQAQTPIHEFYYRSSAWRRYAPPVGKYNRYVSTFYMPFNIFDNPAYGSGYSLKLDAVEGRIFIAGTAQVYIYKCASAAPTLANMIQVAGPIEVAMPQTTTTITDISSYGVEIDTPYFCVGYQIPYEIHYSFNNTMFWGKSYYVLNGTSLYNYSSRGTWNIAAKVSIGSSLNPALSEGFEGGMFPPLNWQRINSGDANAWISSYESPRSELASAAIEAITPTTAAHDDWLISPRLRPTASNSTFSFWAKRSDPSITEKFNVKLSTGSAQSSAFTVSLASNISPPNDYQQYSYSLGSYIGKDVYLAIQATSNPGMKLYVDDVSGPPLAPVFTVPSVPTGLIPANASTDIDPSQSLSWVINGSAVSGVRLYLDTLNPPVNYYDLGAANSYLPPAPLTKGINYYWKVVAYNSFGETSSAIQSFRTTYPNVPGMVTVGEGSSYNAYFQAPCPYGNWNRNQRVQYLYTKDDINEAGGGPGIINSLAFNIYYLNTVQPRFMRIKIGHTTKTQLTSTFETGLNTIFEASTYSPITGWNTHNFNQQFVWDGESNLVVETFYGSLSVQHSINPQVYYTESANRALYYDSETVNANNQTTGTLSSWRANIRFSMQAYVPVQIPNPAILVSPADHATNLTPSVTLSWRNGGKNPAGYYLYLGTDNPPSNLMNGVDIGNVTNYQTPILEYGRDYYWQIVPYNVVGNAFGCVTWSFGTCPDPALPMPYSENFNSASTLAGIGWSGNMSFRDGSGPDGSKILTYILGWHSRNGSATSPQVYPIQPNTMLSFDYRLMDSMDYPSIAGHLDNETSLRVLISTDTGINFNPIYTINSGNHIPATYYRKLLIPLTAFSFGRIILRFEASSNGATLIVDIDNVSIIVNPSLAPEPVNLIYPPDNALNMPLTGFNLAWNPVLGGGFPSSYDLYLGQDPSSILETGIVFPGLTSNCFNLVSSGEFQLQFGQQWYWTVKASNDEGSSFPDEPYCFNLESVTILPYSEDFTGIMLGDLPARWTRTQMNWITTDSNQAGGTAPELRFITWPDDDGTIRAISPPMYGNNVAGYQLSFRNWLQNSEWSWGTSYRVEISENKSTWSTLWGLNDPSGVIGPQIVTLNIPLRYVGKAFYLAWTYTGYVFDAYGWSIDDIAINRLYHIPEDQEVSFGTGDASVSITIEGGNANRLSGAANPPISNGIYNELDSFVLELFGGPWTIFLETTAPWAAYYLNGQWYAMENSSGDGVVLEIDSAKGDLELPITLGDQNPTLPVTLSSFTATLSSAMQVQIAWVSESETDHAGYNVLRSESVNITAARRLNPVLISEGTISGSQVSYLYTDTELTPNTTYYYWLESLSYQGAAEYYGPLCVIVNAQDNEPPNPPPPLETKLLAAYPNPFNPSTTIPYSVKEAGEVKIQIFNLKGQLLRSFESMHSSPGHYRIIWDGKDASGRSLASGIYYYRMSCGDYSFIKKVILTK